MTAQDLIELFEERPSRPLPLRLAVGRFHDIRHPEMAIITPSIVAIGLLSKTTRLAQRVTHCTLSHIVEAEPVEETTQ